MVCRLIGVDKKQSLQAGDDTFVLADPPPTVADLTKFHVDLGRAMSGLSKPELLVAAFETRTVGCLKIAQQMFPGIPYEVRDGLAHHANRLVDGTVIHMRGYESDTWEVWCSHLRAELTDFTMKAAEHGLIRGLLILPTPLYAILFGLAAHGQVLDHQMYRESLDAVKNNGLAFMTYETKIMAGLVVKTIDRGEYNLRGAVL